MIGSTECISPEFLNPILEEGAPTSTGEEVNGARISGMLGI